MKTAFFRLTCVLALTAAALAAPPAVARVVLVDRIVAVVNSEVITASALDERVEQIRGQIARQGGQAPRDEILRRQVLEQLVLERAQLQLAAETGLRVDDDAVGRAIERIAESNRMAVADFRAALERDGIEWAGFREKIRQEMLISRLREREVEGRVVVTDAEIDNYLKSRAEQGADQEYHLAHILLRAPEGASPEVLAQLGEQAAQVRDRALAGEDFARLAAEFSNAPDALSGGDLGWRGPDALPALFAEAVQKLAAGEISPVMRSPAGMHLLKVIEVRGAGGDDAPVQQTRASHILVKTSELVSDEDARQRLETLRTRILGGEDFAALARANSDDLSAAKGGELGWVYPGDTVPEFERVMDALAPGELSEPVKSPFGWHLIRVEARRTQDVSDERKRALARNALRQRKAEEAYEDWLRQLRDGTFVEYRLDEAAY